VQLVYNLTDGSQLRVTHAAWYTPNNRAITQDGLTPDLPISEAFSISGEDLSLQAAIQYFDENYPGQDSEEAGPLATAEPEAEATND
jgi:C-terminal processing protease CtpA/Prc